MSTNENGGCPAQAAGLLMPDVGHGCWMLRGKTSLLLVWPLWSVLIHSTCNCTQCWRDGSGGSRYKLRGLGGRQGAPGLRLSCVCFCIS